MQYPLSRQLSVCFERLSYAISIWKRINRALGREGKERGNEQSHP